jgi:hypothetical protein
MISMRTTTAGALALVLLAGAAAADATQGDRPTPCEADPVRRQFDFWLGDWNVYGPDGSFAGTNRITRTEGGCLIRESWTGAGGGTGFSMNFWDARAEAWRQVWVSPGVQIDYSGGLDGTAMVLEGHITYFGNGRTFPFRGTWTPQDNGDVIQHFQQADPETGAWSDWFIGRYVRADR